MDMEVNYKKKKMNMEYGYVKKMKNGDIGNVWKVVVRKTINKI